MTTRRVLGALLALAAVLAAGFAAAQLSGDDPAADGVAARPADSVVDAYGVGIHTPFTWTAYRDAAGVADALAELGVRHVRDDLYLDDPEQYDAIRTVADRGITFDLILGVPDGDATPEDYVRTVADLPGGAVESVEGVNEWDQSERPDWPEELLDWQRRLYAAVKATPETEDLPVLAPALADREDIPALGAAGDLAAYADVANAHAYPGGYPPGHELEPVLAAAQSLVPDAPLIVTETGYHNAVDVGPGRHRPVPEEVAGVYLPRLLLEHYLRGEQRVYSYELIDQEAEPALAEPEQHFGLLRHDLSPKPAYTAMQTLLGLLADPGPEFSPDALAFSLDGWPVDGRSLLTQKRDGSFVLLLWRDASVWDPALRRPLDVEPADVTLRLPEDHAVAVYRLTQGSTPVRTLEGDAVPVPVGAEITAVTIDRVE